MQSRYGLSAAPSAASKWYNEAKLYVLKYIGHKAAGGDSLGAVERGISIGDIVEGESFSSQPEVNIEAVPKSPPKITFRHGRVKHSLSKGNVNVKMDITKKPVTMEYDSARVNIFMEKNPYLNIKVAQKSKKIDSTV